MDLDVSGRRNIGTSGVEAAASGSEYKATNKQKRNRLMRRAREELCDACHPATHVTSV